MRIELIEDGEYQTIVIVHKNGHSFCAVPKCIETESDSGIVCIAYHVGKKQQEREQEVKVNWAIEWQLEQYDKLLDVIPECPEHGPRCGTYAREWVEETQGENEDLRNTCKDLLDEMTNIIKAWDDYEMLPAIDRNLHEWAMSKARVQVKRETS